MSVVVLAFGLLLLGTPRWLLPVARSLHPRERVRLSVAGLIVGGALVELALFLLALPTVAHAIGIDALAAACRRLLGDLAPGGLQVGWSAAALAILLPIVAYRGWRRAVVSVGEACIESTLGAHREWDGVDVARLPTDVAVAYSTDAGRPQIVISDGLVELLSAGELDAVLRHELAHLRNRDGRLLRVLAGFDAALPALRRVTQITRIAIERSADETAAGADPRDRSTLAGALVRVAAPDMPAAVAGFTSRSGVVERVSGLLGPPPAPTIARRTTAHLAVVGSGGSAALVVGAWMFEAHMMLSMAGVCRM